MHSQLVRFITTQVDQIGDFIYEFGVTFRAMQLAGPAKVRERVAEFEEAL
jgi:hypothetical protein